MTIAISYWLLPLLVTAIVWVWALLTPGSPAYGYDIMPLVRFVGAIIATLAAWLVYFAAQVL